jgi:predicted glycosyltransferase
MAYCHDSVGIGHLRRTLTICERVGRDHPGASFLLATGTPYVQLLQPANPIDFIKLPALKKAPDGTYGSKYLGLSPEQILGCRQALLLETARSFEPDLILVDKAPLGVCRELVRTLRWVKANRPRVRTIFGMRDIEDDAAATRAQWGRDGAQSVIEECYDAVWVYGMRSVFDVVEQYRLSDRIAAKLQYVGYIARPACEHEGLARFEGKTVLVTVGGGTDGGHVLSAYLNGTAQRVAQAGARSIIVGGPDLPGDIRTPLKQIAGGVPNTQWLDFDACMSCRIREADAIVCMGGYNTLCEIAVQGKPALVIPRTQPRLEQKLRAERWERLGLVSMFADPTYSPTRLAERTLAMLERATPAAARLALDGLEKVAAEFRSFWSASDHSPLREPRDATALSL